MNLICNFERVGAALAATALVLALLGCGETPTAEDGVDSPTADGATADGAQDSGWSLPGFGSSSRSVVVPSGETLSVRTTSTLSTATNQSGESFIAHLEEPLLVGDQVVAEKGAEIQGRIVSADKGGRVKGVAQISVQLTELRTVSGDRVAIQTSSSGAQAKQTHGDDAKKIGIGAGIGAAIGAIAGGGGGAAKGAAAGAGAGTGAVLATHGDAAVIPAESVLRFELAEPVTVNLD